MSQISSAIHNIHHADALSARNKWLNSIHPLSKLIVTLWYIILVVSFHKYNFAGLGGMVLYVFITMNMAEISLRKSLHHIWPILLIVSFIGIANPFFDKTVIANIGNFEITGGMVSLSTLMMKGIFTVFASYVLIISTSIENICYALRLLHVPKIMTTLIILIYRYIIVFLKEVERISQAYEMRAPNQKEIHIKVWGTLVGQLLLRSVDRAQEVYESMLLRGYDGSFQIKASTKFDIKSILYLTIGVVAILLLRIMPVFELIGNIFI